MINRENWLLVRAYLQYRREVDLVSESTLRLENTWLLHVLNWAQEKYIDRVPVFRPSYPQYIRDLGHSHVYVSHCVRSARRFFSWLSKHRPGFSAITSAWLDTLKIPLMAIEEKEHEAVTLEEIRAIASAPVESLRDRRARASAVFWFLSGIRIRSFVTLPVSAVDIEKLSVNQFPKLGVKTKFKKHATTYLFDIPDLLEVVRAWDREIRAARSVFWFASVSPDTGEIDPKVIEAGFHRDVRARKDLQNWLQRVGLPYHSPHKFRHGHAVYAIKNARTVTALKAISQNLMHSSLKVTDSIYAILSDMDIQREISALGNTQQANDAELIEALRRLLNRS